MGLEGVRNRVCLVVITNEYFHSISMTQEQQKTLIDEYSIIEKRFHPFKEFLEANKEKPPYKALYKGIITLQGPPAYGPEILFVGINAGAGAYNSLNHKGSSTHQTPLRMIGGDEQFLRELNWYEEGNAHACKVNGKKHQWYERDKKVNNPFVRRMIDLLYLIADPASAHKSSSNSLPDWHKGFGQKIMFTNLYPIATSNLSDLNNILKSLLKEKSFCEQLMLPKHDLWEIKRYLLRATVELIRLTEPRLIVCMGTTAFNDLTFTNDKKNGPVFWGLKENIPVIGFSRRGNWGAKLPLIAKAIEEVKANSKIM